MLKPLKNFIFILVIYSAAIWLANQFSPYPKKSSSYTNPLGISFTLVTVDDRGFHMLYKKSPMRFSDANGTQKKNPILPIHRPYKFYLSNEELKPNNFSEFIAETNYTFDYYFNQSPHLDTSEESLSISKQDAESLANWLSDKERVGYQIVENKEVDLACKDFSKNVNDLYFLQINNDKFIKICSENYFDNTKQYAQANGYRLIRDID